MQESLHPAPSPILVQAVQDRFGLAQEEAVEISRQVFAALSHSTRQDIEPKFFADLVKIKLQARALILKGPKYRKIALRLFASDLGFLFVVGAVMAWFACNYLFGMDSWATLVTSFSFGLLSGIHGLREAICELEVRLAIAAEIQNSNN